MRGTHGRRAANFRRRGFSLAELLTAVVLAGLVGAAAYRILAGSLRVQTAQRDVSRYYGLVASGMDAIREELEKYDGSWAREGWALFRKTEVEGNDVLNYFVPDPALPIVKNAAGVEMSDGTRVQAAFTADSACSQCILTDPAPAAPQAAWGGTWLFWVPGFYALLSGWPNSCNSSCATSAPYAGLFFALAATSPIPSYQGAEAAPRYFAPNLLNGIHLLPRQLALLAPWDDPTQKEKYLGVCKVTTLWSACTPLTVVDAIRAKSLKITFEVRGIGETAAPDAEQLSRVTGVNLIVGGIVAGRSVEGSARVLDVPLKFRIPWRNASLAGEGETPGADLVETKETGDGVTTAGTGLGQSAVEETPEGSLVYVPTITTWGVGIAESEGSVAIVNPKSGKKTEVPIRLEDAKGNRVPFLPATIRLGDRGAWIGGYSEIEGKRTAAIVHVPRGYDGAVDWRGATPQHWVLGDESGYAKAAGGDRYYMTDTANLAVHSGGGLDTVYWSSYTLAGEEGWTQNTPQVYKISSEALATGKFDPADPDPTRRGWDIVHEAEGWSGGRQHLMTALAISREGDRLAYCMNTARLPMPAWTDMGEFSVGDPTSSATDPTGGPFGSPQTTISGFKRMVGVEGDCTGMSFSAGGDAFVSGHADIAMLSKQWMDDTPGKTGFSPQKVTLAAPCAKTPWTGAPPGSKWASRNRPAAPNLAPNSDPDLAPLGSLTGVALLDQPEGRTDLYFVPEQGGGWPGSSSAGRTTINVLQHTDMAVGARYAMTIGDVGYASLMNRAPLNTFVRAAQDKITALGKLLPESGYDCRNETYDHGPILCNRYGASPDTWFECIRKRHAGRPL